MNDLCTTILTRLAASTKDKPVNMDDLREFTADVCTDLDDLDNALDALQDKHIINTVSGMSDGKSYRCFWLTGAKAVMSVGKLAEPQHRPLPSVASEAVAKVQPKISIPTKQPQEQTMPTPSELRTSLLDIISKQPGIKRPSLIKQAIAAVPKATAKQVNKTLGNLYHAAKQIDKTGTRDETAFTIRSGSKSAAKKPPVAPKAKKATVKSSRPKKSKPGTSIAPRPAAASIPAKANGHDKMDFAFNLGGSFSIRKNGQTILLTPNEAMDLMQFGSQQVSMINQIQGESA